MNLTEKKVTEVNEKYNNICEEKKSYVFNIHKLVLKNSINGAHIFAHNWVVCSVDALNDMIAELTAMKEAIEDVTGVC